MKRFVWRLQRILDIKTGKEQKMKSELLELTEKIAETRGVLLMQQRILEDIIAGLAGESPKKRLSKQEFFLRYSGISDERIEKVRRFKEGLERLRAEAKIQFIKEQEKLEQKELDEIASVSFARNMILQE
ncbi:MAG: hypothetical protein ACYSYL_09040 [Planctomycetota bacterium]|jgi:flagellar biosynthesis chaperone FliJ